MPEHGGSGEILNCSGKTCTCGVGPWSASGVCESCGGTDLGMPLIPSQLVFATDDELVDRLRSAEENIAFVRRQITRSP